MARGRTQSAAGKEKNGPLLNPSALLYRVFQGESAAATRGTVKRQRVRF